VDTAPFDDKRVREAIALGLDRDALVQTLFAGKADKGDDHPFAPVFPTAPDASALPPRTRDVARAKQLLQEAGKPNLKVKLSTENYLEIPQYAELVKQQLRDIGVEVELDIMPQNAYYGSGDNQPWLQVPMGIVDWATRGSASQLIAPAYLSKGIWNSAKFKNTQFDTLMAQYDSETDEGRRKEIAAEAARTIRDETPVIIAYWIRELRAVRKNLTGLAQGPNIALDVADLALTA
jgi:peptide/nickel transport system substrate-binding protein